MKKILLLSFLLVFPFHFSLAQDESFSEAESFVNPDNENSNLHFRAITPITVVWEDEVKPPAKKPVAKPATAPTPAAAAKPVAARGLLYEGSFDLIAKEYLALLETKPTDEYTTLEKQQQSFCDRRYQTILNDKKIDIRIAFGYFDWSTGADIVTNGMNFGKSPSVDLGAYKSMEKTLLSACQGVVQVCGFKKDTQEANLYRKTVVIRDQSYDVELRMSQPSVSEFHQENLTKKDQQQAKSDETKRFYMEALQDADLAMYVGHSRSGGGPDFYPPVLKADGKADYQGYYLPNRPGLKVMIEALKSSGRQAPMISVLSCNSRGHFLSNLQGAAPRSGIVSSTRVDTINNLYAAGLGNVDAVLRGQCQKSYYQSMRLDSRALDLVTMDNMFN